MKDIREKGIFQKGGDKPFYMDLKSFNKKCLYEDVEEEALEKQVEKINRRQQNLKKYKYHQDFDRIQRFQSYPITPEVTQQKLLTYSAVIGFLASKIYSSVRYNSYWCKYIHFKLWIPITAIIVLGSQACLYRSPQLHVINSVQQLQLPQEMRTYRALDQNINLYKYVDDIKYRFDYSNVDIWRLKYKFLEKYQDHLDEKIINTIKNAQSDKKRFL